MGETANAHTPNLEIVHAKELRAICVCSPTMLEKSPMTAFAEFFPGSIACIERAVADR
jgi:hypothetical protein